jgi:hypothetical protein
MAEPTPTPLAPAAIAMGTVTLDRPEAHITVLITAREISYAAAKVGDAFSINPRVPAERGVLLVPPSVWMMSAPLGLSLQPVVLADLRSECGGR